MSRIVLKGKFDLDFSKAEEHTLCRNGEELADFVASCVSVSSGGFKVGAGSVKEDDELGRPVAVPGRFYISVGVPELLGKFYEVAPQVALNELFSLKSQEKYGISNFTLEFYNFGSSN